MVLRDAGYSVDHYDKYALKVLGKHELVVASCASAGPTRW